MEDNLEVGVTEDFSPLQVEVGSNFEDAVRRFKSLVQKSKVLSRYKERQQYEKPSEKKRRRKREAKERNRITLLREQQLASGEFERRQRRKGKRQKTEIEDDLYE